MWRSLQQAEYRVRVGATQRQFGGSLHPVDRVANHPLGPGPEGLDWDVSVVHVSKPFVFGQTVQRAELVPQSDTMPPAKKKVQVTGYGAIREVRSVNTPCWCCCCWCQRGQCTWNWKTLGHGV